jgi:DNA uptake protein ComE-like DNA-binding protein
MSAAVALRVAGYVLNAGPQPTHHVPAVLLVDPNTAPAHVLEALPHVGPSLVNQIIQQRSRQSFKSFQDMRRRVRGLGPATLARLAPYLRLKTNDGSLALADELKSRSTGEPPRLAQMPNAVHPAP